MPDVQFGFLIPTEGRDKLPRARYLQHLERALALISGRFDSAWMVDHLQFGDRDMLEGFTALSYLSALHPELNFGHAVLCQSFRSPALLAKMSATLQFMSGGRFILGLGACWHEEEHEAYGYGFPPAAVRVEQLEETLRIIRRMWREETTTFRGRHYQVSEARCEPRPVPVPPIMVGAFKPKMLRLAAQYADWWNVSSTSPEEYQPLAERLEGYCRELSRNPSTIRRTWIGGCACATTPEAAAAVAEKRSTGDDDDFSFIGTPEQLVKQMRSFIDLGVDTFIFDCLDFPELTTLRILCDELLPDLKAET